MLRVAAVHGPAGTEHCVVRNLSADGAMLRLYRPLPAGTEVSLELGEGERHRGTLAWAAGPDVGLKFDQRIALDEVLGSRWAGETGLRRRLPRIAVDIGARLRTGATQLPVRVRDVSQGGARLHVEGAIEAAEAELLLPGFPPLPGLCRWIDGEQAGVAFNERLPFEVLAQWLGSQAPLTLPAAAA
jgi:hypothetical protein